MKPIRREHFLGLAAGASSLLAGSGVAYWSGSLASIANAVVVAVGLAVFATLALVLHLNWNGWATLSIGAWAFAAASILHATDAWMPVILLGLVAVGLCSALLMSTLPPSRRRDRQRFW
jgi:uncharacterized membrane protein YgaE (UPF0421/DUF939 family)